MQNTKNTKKISIVPLSSRSYRGFTLLLAVLISSVLISLGSAIFDIISKEILLSSSGRESQFAFYAADTGIECALYWDLQHDAFSSTSPLLSVDCAGAPRTFDERFIASPGAPTGDFITSFTFPVGSGGIEGPCAVVRVTRSHHPVRTVVQSAGYNTCDAANSLRLERAIRVTY